MKSCSYKDCKPCHDDTYERKPMQRLIDYLDKKDEVSGTFIDVGAHVGLWSELVFNYYSVRSVKPQSFAFEADVDNCQILLQNAQERFAVVPSALWNKREVLGWNKCSHPARRRIITNNYPESYFVQAERLDNIFSEADNGKNILQIDAIKLDIEGTELQALQGMKLLLLKQSPLLIVEVCQNHFINYGYDKEILFRFLTLVGYNFHSEEDKKAFMIEDESFIQLVFFSKENK